jgi:propanol-preferring alcohol dehydrogenase
MRAMVLERPGVPLSQQHLDDPEPGSGELLVRVRACGVCRTDLHLVDGELPRPKLPVVPGHQVVARVEAVGSGVSGFAAGDRVGVPWLGWTCRECDACRHGRENLCHRAEFTGYTRDGGYAEWMVADARYAFPLPPGIDDLQAAPLLCAGLIGYRAYRMAGEARRLGVYGLGAAAPLLCQIAVHQGRQVFAFTRRGDTAAQEFARELGCVWAGPSDEAPPEPLDAAIIFAPVGALVPEALRRVRPGGIVVCAGIHMSPIPSFPYELLWEERAVRSVANLTREDGEQLLDLAPLIPIRTTVRPFPLDQVNEALAALRDGAFVGAAVLVVDSEA